MAVKQMGLAQVLARRVRWKGNRSDQAFGLASLGMGLGVLALFVIMGIKMVQVSLPAIKVFGWGFLSGRIWDPVREEFGAFPFIYGTVVSSLLALLISVPLSLGVAIFLAEMAPGRLRSPVSFLVEMLAAIPSVVYGLWGIFVLAPWLRRGVEPWLGEHLGFLPFFQGPPYGIGMLAGGVILAIMITPTISAISREAIMAVPVSQREGMLALGATRWETIRLVVVPCARSGIMGAVILGLGRALGETMAVTMVIGNRPEISLSLLAPAHTMASVIAEATSDLYRAALTEIGLVLFGVSVFLNTAARLLVWGRVRGREGIRE